LRISQRDFPFLGGDLAFLMRKEGGVAAGLLTSGCGAEKNRGKPEVVAVPTRAKDAEAVTMS